MADITDYPGLNLDELLNQYLPQLLKQYTQPEDKSSPLTSGLLAAGLGMLANANRGAAGGIGTGGLLGLQAYGAAREAQKKDPMQMMQMLTAVQGLQDRQANRQGMADFRNFTAGTLVPQAPLPPQSDYAPGEAPGPVTPPMQSPPLPSVRVTPNLTRDVMQKWLFDQSPDVRKMAETWLTQQEKGQRKLKDVKTLVQDGKRVTVNIFDDGTTEVVPFAPEKEKPISMPMGGKTALLNPDTYEPMKTFIHDPSPESLITDTRTRQEGELNRAQSERHYQQTFGQPTIQQTDLGPVLVDKQAGTARSIRDESGNVIQSDKPLTEVQGKATMFGSRMEAASKILNELESKAGFNVTSPLNRFAGASGVTSPLNYLASKDAQSYKQAQRNWSEAELRFKTGAAVTEREIEDNEKIYFPQPGDGKEQIAQKALARQQAEAGMRVAMGSRGVRQDPQQQPGTPSLSAIEAELRRRGIK